MENAYQDIIDRPYPYPKSRPSMTLLSRAAQFAPFAALSGYEEGVAETARLTENALELTEEQQEKLDRRLLELLQQEEHPLLTVCYFRPDEKKSGGAYVTLRGRLKQADPLRHSLLLESGEEIPAAAVISISGDRGMF